MKNGPTYNRHKHSTPRERDDGAKKKTNTKEWGLWRLFESSGEGGLGLPGKEAQMNEYRFS